MHTRRKLLLMGTIAFTVIFLVNLERKMSIRKDSIIEELKSQVFLCFLFFDHWVSILQSSTQTFLFKILNITIKKKIF